MAFHSKIENKIIKWGGNIHDMFDLAKNAKDQRAKEYLHARNSEWIGGSYEELFKPKTVKKISNTLKRNASTDTYQRQRRKSEYDGDFNFDQKYDIKPFDSSYKKPITQKIINLEAEICFSAGVDSAKIQNFCDLVTGIILDVESKGYLVQFNITGHSYHSTVCGMGFEMNIEIKKPNQYINPQDLMSALSSNFYRRVIFAGITESARMVGKVASGGLGQPRTMGKAFEVSPGKIRFNNLNFENESALKEIYASI